MDETKLTRFEIAFNLIKENPNSTFRQLADKLGNKFTGGVKQSVEALTDCGAVSGAEGGFTVDQATFDTAKANGTIKYVPKKPRVKKVDASVPSTTVETA